MTEIRPDSTSKYASDGKREGGGGGGVALPEFQGWLLGEWLEELDTFQCAQRGFANGRDVRVMYHAEDGSDV